MNCLGMMYPQTPGYPVPPTPLQHIEDMPHLPPDQVRIHFHNSLLQIKFCISYKSSRVLDSWSIPITAFVRFRCTPFCRSRRAWDISRR